MKLTLNLLLNNTLYLLILGACDRPYYEKLQTIQTWQFNYDDSLHMKNSTLASSYAGKGFSRIDKDHPYGNEIFYTIPDSLFQRDIRICVNGYIRSGELRPLNSVAVSLEKEAVFYWDCFRLKEFFKDTGTWVYWQDSTQLAGDVNTIRNAKLAIYGVYLGGKKYLDMDKINITLKTVTRWKFRKNRPHLTA